MKHSIIALGVLLGVGLLSACGSSNPPDVTGPGGSAEPVFTPRDQPPPGEWRKGDMHVHTDHSNDGSFLRQGLDDRAPGNTGVADQIGFATLNGLDFLPLTDHRTWVQHYNPDWESSQLLLIPGEEANGNPHTTIFGHVDNINQGRVPENVPRWITLQQSIWDAHSQGAVYTIAHPDRSIFNIGDGSVEDWAFAVGYDLAEAWNRAQDVDAQFQFADDRWNRGYRFGITASSDNHFKELWLLAGPGTPHTRVLTAANSERATLDGLRAGHNNLSLNALSPVVEIELDLGDAGSFAYLGGDEIVAPAGTPATLRIRTQRAVGNRLLIYKSPGVSAGPWLEESILSPGQTLEIPIEVESEPTWYRAEIRGLALPDSIDPDVLLDTLPNVLDLLVDQLRAATSPIFLGERLLSPQPEEPLPGDIGAADGANRLFGDYLQWSGFPDIASAGQVLHAVAEIHAPGATGIEYRRRDGSGWSPALTLASPGSARFPRVAARGDHVWVVWQDERAGQIPRRPAIYARRSTDGGRNWGPEIIVRALDGRAERPVVAVTADGNAAVAWQEIRARRPFDIWFSTVGDSAGEAFNLSGETKDFSPGAPALDTRSLRYPASVWPAISVADDGRIAVAWQDNREDIDPLFTGRFLFGEGSNPDDWRIQIRERRVGGQWGGIVELGDADMADRHPAIAYEGDGRLWAVWDAQPLSSSGSDRMVYGARDNGDLGFGPIIRLARNERGQGQFPRLSRRDDGSLRAAWYDSRSEDWRWRIMTAVSNADGWVRAGLVMSPANNTWPALAGDHMVFSSDRGKRRIQRDNTQEVFHLRLP